MKPIIILSVLLLSPISLDKAPIHAEKGFHKEKLSQVKKISIKPVEPVSEVQIKETKPVVKPVAVTGNCADWIAQAGITEVASAMELINRESGCNPNAVNPSSGACGVAQELPCGKSGCSLGDGACQVKWMNQYCIERYGSWAGALAHHDSNGWY